MATSDKPLPDVLIIDFGDEQMILVRDESGPENARKTAQEVADMMGVELEPPREAQQRDARLH